MAVSKQWRDEVKPIAELCVPYRGRDLRTGELADLAKAVVEAMQTDPSHQV